MAESEIGFAQLGLASVLKQNQLIVPPNQREYSWTVKEVRTLLQDFAKAISGGDTGSYFLGTIVTIPRAGGALEVVDGQQRLATTAIMFSAIRDALTVIHGFVRETQVYEAVQNIAKATRAYAWSSPIEGSTKRRFFAVLHMGPITSPVEAVRAAIVAESRHDAR